jgi:hypothetical protein
LATYNKAKKLGIFIVSVNWIEACKKSSSKAPENEFPPMNQDKYDSPGLFPRLRKCKSLQPKSDEEFAKMIDAKAKRIRKRLADQQDIHGTPPLVKKSPKVGKKRRSCILDTLKEYEDKEEDLTGNFNQFFI